MSRELLRCAASQSTEKGSKEPLYTAVHASAISTPSDARSENERAGLFVTWGDRVRSVHRMITKKSFNDVVPQSNGVQSIK